MELWIRSTARTNLLKVRFLTVMQGKEFYNPAEWEYKGYTICNCNDNGCYELLGTYKTKERASEVLDEIHDRIATLTTIDLMGLNDTNLKVFNEFLKEKSCSVVYQMPEE